jgi:hypothetical protein
MVQVFLGAGDAPPSEDHVVFRRCLRDAAGNHDSLYNHIEGYAKDINATIPNFAPGFSIGCKGLGDEGETLAQDSIVGL